MTEVVVVRSDEDDSHAPPKRMTIEDVTRMQCRICNRHRIYLQPTRYTVFHYAQIHECKKDKWPLNRRDVSFIGNSDNCKKTGTILRQISPVPKPLFGVTNHPLHPFPSTKIDRSTILVIKNGARCYHNGCPTG